MKNNFTESKTWTHRIFLSDFVVDFFDVFLLINHYHSDILVTTDKAGQQEQFGLKTGKTVVKSIKGKTTKLLAVSAVDAGSDQKLLINGQSVVYLKPTIKEKILLNVLHIRGMIVPVKF